MAQNKTLSLIEDIVGTVVGLLVSFMIQLVLYPILGLDVSIEQNITITIVFFIASLCRGYVIRRIFTKLS